MEEINNEQAENINIYNKNRNPVEIVKAEITGSAIKIINN
jgi:hypothetical protein